MRTMPFILAACIAVPLASTALAQGTAISPGQSVGTQPGAPPAAAPEPASAAAAAQPRPRKARARKASAKKATRKPDAAQ